MPSVTRGQPSVGCGWRASVARNALQFRVSIGVRSPLHTALASVPPEARPQALLRLAEAGLAAPGQGVLPVLERIASAIEHISVVGGAVATPATVPPPASDARLSALDRAFGDDP